MRAKVVCNASVGGPRWQDQCLNNESALFNICDRFLTWLERCARMQHLATRNDLECDCGNPARRSVAFAAVTEGGRRHRRDDLADVRDVRDVDNNEPCRMVAAARTIETRRWAAEDNRVRLLKMP